MKKLIFAVAILLWSTYTVLSQDSIKKYSIGVDFNVGNNALGRKNMYPSIVLSKGKHSLFIGPSIINGTHYRSYAPIYGVQAGYLFYPNGNQQRFNLFFEYDFNYMKEQFEFEFKYNSPNQAWLKKRTIELISIDNYIGFGFRMNIFKGLYIKTNASVGLIIYSEDFTNEFYNGNIIESDRSPRVYVGNFYPYSFPNYRYYDYPYRYNKQFIGLFKFGIGYDFYLKKKAIKHN